MRNRSEFVSGRAQIVRFLTEKREKELDNLLKKEFWAFWTSKIAVRFEYRYHDPADSVPAYGNENWNLLQTD